MLGPGQTSIFTRDEPNANEQKLLFLVICIKFDSSDRSSRRLARALQDPTSLSSKQPALSSIIDEMWSFSLCVTKIKVHNLFI